MYYTYVLESLKDGKRYIGFTGDLKSRLNEHNLGVVKSTSPRGKLRLIYYEACLNKEDAIYREKYFKSGFGRRYLKGRLQGYCSKRIN